MPPRGNAPGLKRGRHNLPYWIARQVVRDPMGFPDACIPLPPDADDATLAALCREHTARLYAWIEQTSAGAARRAPRYDGTVLSACRVYQEHPHSPFHAVKHNTRRYYAANLAIIEATVGRRLIRNLTVLDIRHWYVQWRSPAKSGGPERIDRAHDAVTMFRTVIAFCAALRHRDCKQLSDELKQIKSASWFEKGGAREAEMTFAQAKAFVRKALELGGKGVIPAVRARSLAIGVAAQFELLLRQKDIIGEWPPTAADVERARARGATAIRHGGDTWTGYFTWENVPGWRWRMKTSKSKYRAAAEFDLANYPLLHPLLESVPHAARAGAIVTDEHGLPVRESSYRKWFRACARAAGIPDAVWLMDSRAGGATEAEEAGVPLELIREALTHSKQDTTVRYIRRRSTRIASVAEARKRAREAGEGSA